MLRAALNHSHREGWIGRVPRIEIGPMPPPESPRKKQKKPRKKRERENGN